MRTATRRLPVDDLKRAVGAATDEQLARDVGSAVRSVGRWRRRGGIPLWEADRLAIRVGLHPAVVWGADWWADEEDDR